MPSEFSELDQMETFDQRMARDVSIEIDMSLGNDAAPMMSFSEVSRRLVPGKGCSRQSASEGAKYWFRRCGLLAVTPDDTQTQSRNMQMHRGLDRAKGRLKSRLATGRLGLTA